MNEQKLAGVRAVRAAIFNTSPTLSPSYTDDVPIWSSNSVDKMSVTTHDSYASVVEECRFYYRVEPIAHTVVKKIVDLAINSLIVVPEQRSSKTEQGIFEALSKDLMPFLRKAALEYLLTGLVVPEISLTRISKRMLAEKEIPRVRSLLYPTDMWLRDSGSILIKSPLITNTETFFVLIPEETSFFIQTKGTYPDGSEDIELYNEIASRYPEFVAKILAGETKVKLDDNPLIVKSTTMSNSPYPVPYLYPAIESMRHKRNLKKMDYSIAARVISAILHVTVGDKDYPLTADQEDVLDDLEAKFKWRQSIGREEIERVFTLFTNHTVDIKWVFPDVNVLLDEQKYATVNKDIMVALGFPRILITGETERSFASDPQIATLSPLETMNRLREVLLPIVQKIFMEMKRVNNVINSVPVVKFAPINLLSLDVFYAGISELYATGNLSREAFARAFGYDLKTELQNRVEEQALIEELGLQEFAPVPHSNEPNQGNVKKEQKTGEDNNGDKE